MKKGPGWIKRRKRKEQHVPKTLVFWVEIGTWQNLSMYQKSMYFWEKLVHASVVYSGVLLCSVVYSSVR